MDKVKRIAAIIGLILFASIFIVLLVSSFFATKQAPGLFLACVFSALVIPIMIYMFVAVYKMVHKNDKQDSDNGSSAPEDDIDSDENISADAPDANGIEDNSIVTGADENQNGGDGNNK